MNKFATANMLLYIIQMNVISTIQNKFSESTPAEISGATHRKCPICESSKYDKLVDVDPITFIKPNPTLDLAAYQASKLSELPPFPVVRCKKCKFVFTPYLLDNEYSKIFWNDVFISTNSKQKIRSFRKRKRILELWYQLYSRVLEQGAPKDIKEINVLDLGCGWGDLLTTAKAEAVNCYGTEIDEDKIDYCRNRGILMFKSLEELPSELKFDIFFSNQVFEHLPNPKQTLEKIKSHLTKEFIGYIAVPNYSKSKLDKTVDDLISGKGGDKDFIPWDHLNYFTPESLRSLLNNSGFEVFDTSSDSTEVFFRHRNSS